MENQVFLDFGLRFNLRQRKTEKPTIIYAVFMWNGVQHKVNTLLKVYPSHWDTKSQSATVSNRLTKLDNSNNRIVNKQISSLKELFLERKCYLCKNLGLNIVQEITKIVNPQKNVKMKKNDAKRMTDFLLDMLSSKQTTARGKYNSGINRLKEFLKENKINDDINNLNGETLNKYQDYLAKQGKSITTIRNYVADIKTLVRRSRNKSYQIDLSDLVIIEDKRSKEEKKSKNVPLTEDQLRDLYNLKNLTEKEIEARDLFLCQSLLGQRISDMPKLFKGDYKTNDHGNGMETISFNVQKTGEEATLYLFPIAKEIINKYREKKFVYYDLFETDEKKLINYERTINSTIKDVCEKAGFNSEIIYAEQIGEQVIYRRKPLYELMHTHIARHTFITLMCQMGVDKEIVIIATAHTDTKMIDDVYLHESPTEKGKKLIEAIKKNNSQSTFFKVPDSSETTAFLNNIFAYDVLLKLKKADEQGINIEELEERKEVISRIKRIPNINVPSEIDKSFVDRSINEVFPTLLLIADTPTMILFIQKISRLDISGQINNSTEGELIKDLQEIGSQKEFLNQICSVWEKEKNKDHFKDRLFENKKEDDRVISLEDSLKEIADYVRKKITIE